MAACCERWIHELFPMNPRDGVFEELHVCPSCGIKYYVKFDCHGLFGSDWACSAIGARRVS